MRSSIASTLAGILFGAPLCAQVTQRVSVDSSGAQTIGGEVPVITPDGRFVAFWSLAFDLVPGDTNFFYDVFVRDRQNGTTERVTLDSSGSEANWESYDPSITPDGRYVAFSSLATNLVPGDTNDSMDVFVRDRQSGTTERVSVDSLGLQGNDLSANGRISSDGRYVAFWSEADNLVPGDTNTWADIFIHDRLSGSTEIVSVGFSGAPANHQSFRPSISADGRYVAFESTAANLVPGDTLYTDIFVRDRLNATTERVSVDPSGGQADFNSADASISLDGRYVAFDSGASNLVPGDTGWFDVFLRDRQSGTTVRVSVDPTGAPANGTSFISQVSGDGRHVAFASQASNLVAGDTNGTGDIFVRDILSGTTERVSVSSAGVQGDDTSTGLSISLDGRFVAFDTRAENLVPDDSNDQSDIFVRDRTGGPSFTSLCDPGTGGVMPCPCANPPSGPGRGCNNSSSTGGAILSASGGTYLSSDSLVFATSGEKPTALSIVSQWTGTNPAGVTFGQGVRCTSGTLKRLYTKSASGGSITAPNFGAGDPQVSVRSATLGDAVLAGQNRWYFVYYRDPTVLGGCPATSTFNATQTGQVTWSP